MIGRRALVGALVAPSLLAAGCTNTKVGPPTTVTVERTVQPSAPNSAAAPSSSTAPARPISTAAMSKLPGRCGRLLAPGSIDAAVHHRVTGRTAFVIGLPDASIGRLSYINCQYGVPHGNTAVARVEIQVSLYRTAGKATARVKPTVNDYTEHGAHLHKTQISGFPAILLTGGTGTGYGPTALMALGQRTVVVTLRPGAFATATVTRDLTALAGLAARRTSAG